MCTEQELGYWNMLDILGTGKISSCIISHLNEEMLMNFSDTVWILNVLWRLMCWVLDFETKTWGLSKVTRSYLLAVSLTVSGKIFRLRFLSTVNITFIDTTFSCTNSQHGAPMHWINWDHINVPSLVASVNIFVSAMRKISN